MPRSRPRKVPGPPAVAVVALTNDGTPLIPPKLVAVHKFQITIGMRARLDALRQAGNFTSEAEVPRCVLKARLDALQF